MYKGYVNADYTIQFFHEIGNNGVAIGVRSGIKNDPAPFVVWNYAYENGVPSFYWGAYSDAKTTGYNNICRKSTSVNVGVGLACMERIVSGGIEMNYKKLYEWASKIQMNGKPSLNYIFRDADGTFSAVSESMGFNVSSLPEGIPFREETPFYLASKLKRDADLYDYTICDAPHLYCIKIKECKTGEVSGKTILM